MKNEEYINDKQNIEGDTTEGSDSAVQIADQNPTEVEGSVGENSSNKISESTEEIIAESTMTAEAFETADNTVSTEEVAQAEAPESVAESSNESDGIPPISVELPLDANTAVLGEAEVIWDELFEQHDEQVFLDTPPSDSKDENNEESSDGEEIGEENTEEDTEVSETSEQEVSEDEEKQEEKPRRIDAIFDILEISIFTLAGVFLLMSFFFRYSIVDGGSMKNTLQDDERLLISNFLYTPKCGDVVVVQDKSTALKDPIVKRIIAVGGQKVKITNTDIYVDGAKLDEPYVYTGDYTNSLGASVPYKYSVYPSDELLDLVVDYIDGVYYEILVPEGEIFVMGDHRNNSTDSRAIGTLHEDAIIGKAIYRFFPFNKAGKIE